MNDIVLRNRKFGPEALLQLVEERAPNGFDRIEEVISREDLDRITGSFLLRRASTSKRSTQGRHFSARRDLFFQGPSKAALSARVTMIVTRLAASAPAVTILFS